MKKIAAGLMALCITSAAFGSLKTMHKKRKKQVKKTTTSVVANSTKIKSVMMGRSACYGKCPVYTIEVFETGLLRYTGKNFVDNIGVFEKNIAPAATVNFIKEFNAMQPENLSYTYERKIADLPGIYYLINYPDSVKHVYNADAGPELLKTWARKFDTLGVVDQSWKKQNTDNIKK